MTITANDLIMAIVLGDYDTVQRAIAQGFDLNISIPGKRPLVEAAQAGEDLRMLRQLWAGGAQPTTPWLSALFADF